MLFFKHLTLSHSNIFAYFVIFHNLVNLLYFHLLQLVGYLFHTQQPCIIEIKYNYQDCLTFPIQMTKKNLTRGTPMEQKKKHG